MFYVGLVQHHEQIDDTSMVSQWGECTLGLVKICRTKEKKV